MSLAGALIAGYVAGLAGGAAYLWLLWRSANAVVAHRTSPARVALTALGRVGAVLVVVFAAAKLGAGAGALLAALLGFLTVRVAATALARRGARAGPAE